MEAGLLIFNAESNGGDIFSPMFFNAALECALRKWKGKCEHHGIAVDHHERLTNIRYADGLMLYARSLPPTSPLLFSCRSQGETSLNPLTRFRNGQRSTLYAPWGSPFQGQRKHCQISSYIRHCLQNSKKIQEDVNTISQNQL